MDPTKLYLAQTDTTAGFLSQDAKKLAEAKKRSSAKPFLIAVDSFATLKKFTRVPKRHKNLVRRAKKVTFVYPNNKALRVVKDRDHLTFLSKLSWAYSTSANRSGKDFDEEWARSIADVVVEDSRGLFAGRASRIVKLGKRRRGKLR